MQPVTCGTLHLRSAAIPCWLGEDLQELSALPGLSATTSAKTEYINVLKLTNKADRYNPILFIFQKLGFSKAKQLLFFSPFIATFFRKQIL